MQENKKLSLDILKEKASTCTRCPDFKDRIQIVFGHGNINAKLLICAEGPGSDEDKQGIPFVGAAGGLLDNIVSAAGWKREDLYILNTVLCRPPNNRTPTSQEVENCSEYFLKQIEIVNPQFMLLLGSAATNAILGASVTVVRGQIYQWRDKKVFSTYHPAYLFHHPEAKVDVWKDLQPLIQAMK
jgi:DNA polymerase